MWRAKTDHRLVILESVHKKSILIIKFIWRYPTLGTITSRHGIKQIKGNSLDKDMLTINLDVLTCQKII